GALDPSGGASESAGATARRPYGLYVHGRYDTTGAIRSVTSIVQALGWQQAYDVLDVLGDVTQAHEEQAYELGATLAAGLTG
ncbi:MAG: flavodoxin family protein, partial [Nocardioides sp.]|nr:flavodoxin family protein [Nocardioides sp.]